MSGDGDRRESARLWAEASGRSRIFQAAGDQVVAESGDIHLHYEDGVRRRRRARVRTARGAEECPYPGLAAFEQDDARYFFGRDSLTADILTAMDDRTRDGGGPLVVVAPSGAGKSSLLRAGVLAALADGDLPGSAHWPRLLLTPTASPLAVLTARLAEAAGTGADAMSRALASGPEACAGLLRAGADRLVIVVDQVEELFTLCESEHERRVFLDILDVLSRPGTPGGTPRALVVLGLRSDFYTRCADYPRLRSALQDRQIVVGPLSEDGLREAVLFPAREAGLTVEPGLAELLLGELGDVTYEAGRLPLLAHALRVTWQQRHGSTLTVDGYRTTGGIRHAVATTAETTFARLDASGQEAARELFLRLVRVGDSTDGRDDARRRLRVTEEVSGPVLDAFTTNRLLTRERDTVTITHEALLHAWPRLRAWTAADREDRLARQRLEEAAALWDESGRDPDLLYRGSPLDAARRGTGTDGAVATAFLAASLRGARRAARVTRAVVAALTALALIASVAAVVAFVQRDTAETERDTARFRQLTATADRLRESDPSLAAQLDLAAYRLRPKDDGAYTRLLNDADATLSTPLTGQGKYVKSVAFSPDGKTLLSFNTSGARLWDMSGSTGPVALAGPLPGTNDVVETAVFSPDGHTLAIGDDSGQVWLWDTSEPARPAALGRPLVVGDIVARLAFSPDGRTLAALNGGALRLWDVTDPAHAESRAAPSVSVSGDDPSDLVFSPDGDTLAVLYSARSVRLWNVADPSRPRLRAKPLTSDSVDLGEVVAFSPDSGMLAVPHETEVWLWNVTDPDHPKRLKRKLTAPYGLAATLAFSPDGDTLVTTGSERGDVRLWDVSTFGYDPASELLSGHTDTVYAVAFNRGGTLLATASHDRTVRLWNIDDPRRPQQLGTALAGHTADLATVAFNPAGDAVASAGTDGTVRVWRLPGTVALAPQRYNGYEPGPMAFTGKGEGLTITSFGQPPVRLDTGDIAHPRPVKGPPREREDFTRYGEWTAVNPDRHLAMSFTGDMPDGSLALWDITRPSSARRLSRVPVDEEEHVRSAVLSPDGRMAAWAGDRTTVQLLDLHDPRHPKRLARLTRDTDDNDEKISVIAFAPDGKTLALGDFTGALQLWDIGDPVRPRPLGRPMTDHDDTLSTLAYSPDGSILATAGPDRSVRLWDVGDPAHPKHVGKPLVGHTDEIPSMAFTPDGRTLVSAGRDGTVRLWDVDDPRHPEARGEPLTGHTDAVTSLAVSPDGEALATTGADATVRLWPLDPEWAVERICAASRGALTRGLWQRHVPGAGYRPPCR